MDVALKRLQNLVLWAWSGAYHVIGSWRGLNSLLHQRGTSCRPGIFSCLRYLGIVNGGQGTKPRILSPKKDDDPPVSFIWESPPSPTTQGSSKNLGV